MAPQCMDNCRVVQKDQCKVDVDKGSRVGVTTCITKAASINFSVNDNIDLANVLLKSPQSHSYLTGVTAAELQ